MSLPDDPAAGKRTPQRAQAPVRQAWLEIVGRAPRKSRGDAITEHADDLDRSEGSSAPRSDQTEKTPPIRASQLVLNSLADTYPEGVPLTLPRRPWGDATARVFGWGGALVVLIIGFALVSATNSVDLTVAIVVAVILAIPVGRRLISAILDQRLRQDDAGRLRALLDDEAVTGRRPRRRPR